MEMVASILELGKMILAPIRKYYNYHRNADKNRNDLNEKWENLKCRKTDVESKMAAELLPGKSPKEEVKFWLGKVDTIDGEIQNIEEEASKGTCFSRMRVGKLACEKVQEVKELFDQSCGFIDNLVVDPPISHGEVLPTATLVGESTATRTMKRVWEHLIGEDFRKIGVYGMGGIGKTTVMKEINNRLLKETDKFDNVIWVTVSKASNVLKLQNDIACNLDLDLSKYKDETIRAGKLNVALENKKRYVLILDDMWEAFRLEDVGIPEPTPTNGCKLVLTTRSVEVCNKMSCENIKIELLSEEESGNLFLDIVGRGILNTPNLEAIVEDVVKECACLPLAIITIAGSLKKVVHASEWRNALEELRTSIKGSNNAATAVFERLQFSYKRLKDEKLQHCLLYCALYQEDYQIDRDELIERLIDEGVIKRMRSRQVEFDKGHTMLNRLENACLLEGGSCDSKYFVKMHDLIRDMALQIAGPKFMVELEDFQDEEKWGKDLVKVSLMRSHMPEFPYISPRCPKLSTLLLKGSYFNRSIPDCFFVHLHGLNVLDLSLTGITSLPSSVSDLENLTTLSLSWCESLTHVPSLAKLTALRKLDLWRSRIKEIPRGLEMLVNLRYLDLDACYLEKMPLGILPKLTQLQVLKLNWFLDSLRNGEEIVKLKKLEYLKGRFYDINHFNTYVGYLEEEAPITISNYLFFVGEENQGMENKIRRSFDLVQKGKLVILCKCNISLVLLPKDVQTLVIYRCDNLRSSLDASFLKHAKELKSIYIWWCEEIGDTISLSYPFPLQSLECVNLGTLDNLRIPFGEERVALASAVTPGTFSCLKIFKIFNCPNIKKLFTPGLLINLGNLEEIDVFYCKQLEEIIGGVSDDEVEEKAEEIEETGMGSNVIFPKLRILKLWDLPELKTICSSSNVIVFDSPLQQINIFICPKLKRLPLSLRLTNGQPSFPPSLRIVIMKEEWELLECDNHDTKTILEPRCLFQNQTSLWGFTKKKRGMGLLM